MKSFPTLCALLGLVAASVALATEPRLQLRNGDYWSGTLAGPAEFNVIRWQTPKTFAPLDFKSTHVGAVHFPQTNQYDQAASDICVELLGGDVLFGSLMSLDENQLELATSQFGVVSIATDVIARITSRNQLTGIEYAGPNGLDGWEEISTKAVTADRARPGLRADFVVPVAAAREQRVEPAEKDSSTPAWREEAGQLVADRPSEPLSRDCSVPEKCEIEFSVSWQGTGNFRITFYVDGSDDKGNEGPALPIHFQVWNRDLVMVAEGFDRADLALIKNLGVTGGRLHAVLFIDRPAGHAELYSIDGQSLGRVALPSTQASDAEKAERERLALASRRGRPATRSGEQMRILRERQGITIQNAGGEFRFERLVVRRWDGRLPSQGDSLQVRVVTAAGDRLEASSIVFDQAATELVISTDGDDETRLPIDQLASIVFPNSHASKPMAYRVTLGDSTRLSGDLQILDDQTVRLVCRDVSGDLMVPTSEISSIISLDFDGTEKVDLRHREGRLIAEGVYSTGVLVDAVGGGERSSLVWHAWGSTTPQPLVRGLSGRIEYVDLKQLAADEAKKNRNEQRNAAQQPQVEVNRQVGLFGFLFGAGGDRPSQGRGADTKAVDAIPGGTLYLASGERIPCELTGISDADVTFESNITAATKVPRDQVLMWERDPETKLEELDAEKRRRLFTVPRIQKNNPPTHVLESTDGDFLRARLVGCDSETFVVEVRLESKELPADKVRRVVWLDEVASDEKDEAPTEGNSDADNTVVAANSEGETSVLAVYRSSLQLALTPNELASDELKGISTLLGTVQIAIDEVDVLYFGDEVAKQARAGKLSQWQLAFAKDPKFMSEDEGGASGEAGLGSPLVGQPAPDFKLKTLDGEQFELAEEHGQVVILDFFATWCGPCVQAMHQVDAVAEEFADKGVKLIAVNMQEDNESVAGLMERLKITPMVVMDIDGATAAKYKVSAIPQTVIIGRDGKVARLFVGGGPSFAADLRAALEAVTAE